MRFYSRFACIPILFAATLSHGATPYEGDLPIELARYFTGGGFWYSDLPDGFPPFTLPAGFQTLGALDQTQRKQVILTTTLEPNTAVEALAEAFMAEGGWTRIPVLPAVARKPRGFIEEGKTATQPAPQPVHLCHNSLGTLQIDSKLGTDAIQLSFGSFPRNGAGCARLVDVQRQALADEGATALIQNIPVLELPAGSTRSITPSFMNQPVPENEFETNARLRAEDQSLRLLNRNFTRQMRRQGWKREEQWSGELSAGSSWTRETEDDRRLSAVLTIVRVAEADYEMSMRLHLLE